MMSALTEGALLAVVSGMMNGSFTLPMKYLGRWEWENVWSLFILVSCLLLPIGVTGLTAPHALALLAQAPPSALAAAALAGFAWGFGAIMFGQSVSAVGISMANTLVLALSSALGAVLPLLILDRSRLWAHQGQMILAGTAIAVAGIALCGRAGWMRERAGSNRGEMVGHARPLSIALLLCIGSGVLSAVFNIGYSLAQPIVETARGAGLNAFAGSNLIWLLMLCSGSLANLGFCVWLLIKNGSMHKFRLPGSGRLYGLSTVMGLLWGGSIFVYGAASPQMGRLGPAIGWPLSLAAGLLVANFWGLWAGEWKSAPADSRRWMWGGISVLLVAIVVLSRAG